MELIFKNEFTDAASLKPKKHVRSKATSVTIKCFVYSPEKQILFAGLSDGHIYMWQRKRFEEKVPPLFLLSCVDRPRSFSQRNTNATALTMPPARSATRFSPWLILLA